MVSIIAAMSRNRIIGAAGIIPWSVPADMRRFRELTLGHTLIMGRKTFESIGRPLQGRKNIILTRQADYCADGVHVSSSLEEALHLSKGDDEIFICGGSEVYAQALPYAARIYLTQISLDIEGDAKFPPIPPNMFFEISREMISETPPADLIIFERAVCPARVCRR